MAFAPGKMRHYSRTEVEEGRRPEPEDRMKIAKNPPIYFPPLTGYSISVLDRASASGNDIDYPDGP
jgi:hypothetical protein